MFFTIALLLMIHEGHEHPAPRIDLQNFKGTLVELPPVQHHHHIDKAELAKSTIAYCERTGQTVCENHVSEDSGGASVKVCKIDGTWNIDGCE